MFSQRKTSVIQSERLTLRLPEARDYIEWADIRRNSAEFLEPWEPVRDSNYMSRRAFQSRAAWARRMAKDKRALYMLMFCRNDGHLVGGITLDNIQAGVSKSCTVGYWMGQEFTRQGYMTEALAASVMHAFTVLDISRIQAGCLPENAASRALLENPDSNTRASRKAICKSLAAGATTFYMPTCDAIVEVARIKTTAFVGGINAPERTNTRISV